VQFMEIYLERVKDLLDTRKTNLPIREDLASGRGIYVEGITEEYVTSPEDLTELMKTAAANRAVASTGMNAGSSRSHSVTIIRIHQKDTTTGSTKSGKLCLVDLAGSEMISKTGAKGQTLEEAKMINKSLSALGNVINALTEKRTGAHIPYRDSKLTRLLQESLGGNACTVLVVCTSPSSYNATETISTLRFGNRAKRIENKAKVNQQRSVEELTALLRRAERAIDMQQQYIKKLEVKLAGGVVEAPKKKAAAAPDPAATDAASGGGSDGEREREEGEKEEQGGGERPEGQDGPKGGGGSGDGRGEGAEDTPNETGANGDSGGGGESGDEEGRRRSLSADMGAVGTVQLEVRIQELEDELKEVKRDLEEERELGGERLRVLQTDMDQVKEAGAGAQRALVTLQEECKQAKARADMEVTLKDSLAEQVDEAKGRVAAMKQEKSKLEFDLEQQRVTVERLSTQNNNLTEELDNMMLQKQSREEVEQVMQQAAPNTPKGATTPGGSDLREENARLNATVKELSARVAQAMAASVTTSGGSGVGIGGEIDSAPSGMIAMLTSPRASSGAAAVKGDGDGASDDEQDQKDANLAVWAALGPEAQLSELAKMHRALERVTAQHNEVVQTKTEQIEHLEASDTALVRREIVDQNKKLQIDVHNLVKDLKNRCQKVIQLELALDKERDLRKMLESRAQAAGRGRGGRNAQGPSAAQAKQMKALQKRLEQLVMVHRQLLRKYAQVRCLSRVWS
jgi:kinesin family protein 5